MEKLEKALFLIGVFGLLIVAAGLIYHAFTEGDSND
jgi:hypothetical protein